SSTSPVAANVILYIANLHIKFYIKYIFTIDAISITPYFKSYLNTLFPYMFSYFINFGSFLTFKTKVFETIYFLFFQSTDTHCNITIFQITRIDVESFSDCIIFSPYSITDFLNFARNDITLGIELTHRRIGNLNLFDGVTS